VRLHCLGIGSASQDRFLALLARETGGVSRFVTPRERVDLAAVDLFASIGRPVVSGLRAGDNIQPEPSSLVFKGTPVVLFGEVAETQPSQIELTWQGGALRLDIPSGDSGVADTLWLLQGSRLITDWESRYPGREANAPLEKRKQNRVAARLMELSRTYGLASREMSLVAVVTRPGDRPDQLPETRVVPVGMPQDTAFGAYFGSRMRTSLALFGAPMSQPIPPPVPTVAAMGQLEARAPLAARSAPGLFEKLFSRRKTAVEASHGIPRPAETAEDILLDLASRMDSDGGMPGKDTDARAGAAVIALLAFVSLGHTLTDGAFRTHVARLVSFLSALIGVSSGRQQIVAAVLELVRNGETPSGDWLALARASGDHWKEVETSIRNARANL